MNLEEEMLKERALMLLDMVEDWATHASDARQRILNMTEELWSDADFTEIITFLAQCVAELGN